MTPALTSAIEAVDAQTNFDDPRAALVAAKVRGLMFGYDARWSGVQMEIISIEELIQTQLLNPESNRASRTFTLAGKKDVTVRYQNQTVLIDHKTTSDDIGDPNSPYWRQLTVEAQPSHYMLMDFLLGNKVDYAIWDAIRKPGIAPKALSKADAETAATTGIYCGFHLDAEDIDRLRAGDKQESLAMYTCRLADDCTHQRPSRYFQRRAVPRLDHQLAEHAAEVWDLGQEMINARSNDRWPRNSGACMNYNSPCKYLGICSGQDSPDSERWQIKQAVHAELPMLNGDGRDVLTFSRLKTFQTCRKKHFYAYELGIERIDEEEKEALYFGTLLHHAHEAWFNHQPKFNAIENQHPQGNQYGNADLTPANAVGAIGSASEALLAC
jgi:hypothetical protein